MSSFIGLLSLRSPARVRIIMYNIMLAGGNNLNMALRAMDQMHVDLGIFTKTKLNHDMYMQDCYGYSIVVTRMKTSFQGGVALFYWNQALHWSVRGIQTHGHNVISCILVAGNNFWMLIGAYIPPSKDSGETLMFIDEAVRISKHLVILLGNINLNLHDNFGSDHADDIALSLALHGLEDVEEMFSHPQGCWTYSQWCEGCYIWSTTDCMLAEWQEAFMCWVIKILRHYHSDHCAIVVELKQVSTWKHWQYVCCWHKFPSFLMQWPLSQVDQLFEDLLVHKKPPDPRTECDWSWIASDMWSMIDWQVELTQWIWFSSNPSSGCQQTWTEAFDPSALVEEWKMLGKDIHCLLHHDHWQQAECISQEIKHCITAKISQELMIAFMAGTKIMVGLELDQHTKIFTILAMILKSSYLVSLLKVMLYPLM